MYHTIIVVGNVGRDAEMRYTPSGAAVASFSVATNRQYTASSGEQIKETIWFRISAWGKQAEICNQYVKKGMKVLVEGRLTADQNTGGPRVYTRNDGSPGASYEVTVQQIKFLGSASNGNGASQEAAPVSFEDDTIPF